MADRIFNILGSLIVLATVSTLVINAAGTSTVVGSFGSAFTNALKVAQGR